MNKFLHSLRKKRTVTDLHFDKGNKRLLMKFKLPAKCLCKLNAARCRCGFYALSVCERANLFVKCSLLLPVSQSRTCVMWQNGFLTSFLHKAEKVIEKCLPFGVLRELVELKEKKLPLEMGLVFELWSRNLSDFTPQSLQDKSRGLSCDLQRLPDWGFLRQLYAALELTLLHSEQANFSIQIFPIDLSFFVLPYLGFGLAASPDKTHPETTVHMSKLICSVRNCVM